jgi:hypothetical protein
MDSTFRSKSQSSRYFEKTELIDDSDFTVSRRLDNTMNPNRLQETIKLKIDQSGVSWSRILSACEKIDRNNDGVIHIDDFEEVLDSALGPGLLTRREKRHLIENCNFDKKYGNVSYMRLVDFLKVGGKDDRTRETWRDTFNPDENDEFGHVKPNTIGEWLRNVACPAEVTNYKLLMLCLEKFEDDSGMRIKFAKNGSMVVPLGPDLKAEITFKIT